MDYPTVVTSIELIQRYNVPRVAGGESLYRTQFDREKLNTVYIKSDGDNYILNDIKKTIEIPPNRAKSFYFDVIPIKGFDLIGSKSTPPSVSDILEVKYIDPYSGEQQILKINVEID